MSSLKPQSNQIMRGVRAKILRNLKLMRLLSESLTLLRICPKKENVKKKTIKCNYEGGQSKDIL